PCGGKQRVFVTAPRYLQVPKGRGKRLRRRNENFRRATGFPAGDEDAAVVKERSSAAWAGCGHGGSDHLKTALRIRGIKNLGGMTADYHCHRYRRRSAPGHRPILSRCDRRAPC